MTTGKLKYLLRRQINGAAYVYFRDRAGRLTRLPGAEGSAEFQLAYDVALRAMLTGGEGDRHARPSTGRDSIEAAIALYLASSRFAGLAPSTRQRIGQQCDAIRGRLGSARLRDLDVHAVDIYSEQVARKHGASVADRHVHVLSSVWQSSIKYPQFQISKLPNPTAAAESHYRVQREHRPWPLELQEQFMATAPDNLRLAKLLLHFSVQRGGDCIRMRWTDYDGAGLYVRPEKTHGERAAEANYHLCPEPLREALEAAPRLAETILVNGDGKPYAAASVLSKAIKRHLIRIGAAKKGERSFVMHGLRKTGAVDAVMAGAGVPGLKSLGWKSDSQALYYVRGLDTQRANRNTVDLWNAELRRQIGQRAHDRDIAARRSSIRRVV